MKKALVVLCFLGSFIAKAQDTLIFKNGNDLIVKLFEVTPSSLKYKQYNYQEGPLYTINKEDVFMIRFSNGVREVIQPVEPPASVTEKTYKIITQAQIDADWRYKPSGASTGTAITTLVAGGLIGLIPAIVCSSTPPIESNLNMPPTDLQSNKIYKQAYKDRAKKIKSKAVWTSWGASMVINAVIVVSLFYR